jgi:cytochrome c biogenesis factor
LRNCDDSTGQLHFARGADVLCAMLSTATSHTRTRRALCWAAALALVLALGGAATSQTSAVDLQLVLAVDASGSVNQARFDLQKQGYAAGARDTVDTGARSRVRKCARRCD